MWVWRVRAEPVAPHAVARREKPGKMLRRRAPFLAVATFGAHRVIKWRRALRLVRPRYLLMSFLFVGWTGGWSAGAFDGVRHARVTEKRPFDDEDDEDEYRPSARGLWDSN